MPAIAERRLRSFRIATSAAASAVARRVAWACGRGLRVERQRLAVVHGRARPAREGVCTCLLNSDVRLQRQGSDHLVGSQGGTHAAATATEELRPGGVSSETIQGAMRTR